MQRFLLPGLIFALAACVSAPLPPASPGAGSVPTPDFSTACGGAAAFDEPTRHPGWPPEATFELIPIPVSSELAIGENRLLLNVIDSANEPLASPDRELELRLYNLARDAASPASTVAAEYLPTTEALPGLYRASVHFSCWGEWGLETITTEPDGSQRSGRMIFSVRPSTTTPAIGAPAPVSTTPTARTAAELALLTTDSQPDPDFYRTSVDEALEAGRPFLLIFSTPAFCRTRTCGPALDIVKSAASGFKDEVAFIHVEPYRLEQDEGQLRPVLDEQNQPIAIDAVAEWGLPSEPYIFVVDAGGRVTAKLEGVASEEEIEAALREVAGR